MNINPKPRYIARAKYTDSIILLSNKSARYRLPLSLADASYGDITVGELKLLHVLFFEHISYRESIRNEMQGNKDHHIRPITLEIEKRVLMRTLGLESNRLKSYFKKLEKAWVEPNIADIWGCHYRVSPIRILESWSENKGLFTINLTADMNSLLLRFPKMHARVDMRAILSLNTLTSVSLYPIAAYTATVARKAPLRLEQLQAWSNSAYPEHVFPGRKTPDVLVPADPNEPMPWENGPDDYEYITSRPVKNKDRWKFYSVTLPAALSELCDNPHSNLSLMHGPDTSVNTKFSNLFFEPVKKRKRIVFSPNIILAADIPEGDYKVTPREFVELMVEHDEDAALNYGTDAITVKSGYLKDFVQRYIERANARSIFKDAASLIADMLKRHRVTLEFNPNRVAGYDYPPLKNGSPVAAIDWREMVLEGEIEYINALYDADEHDTLWALDDGRGKHPNHSYEVHDIRLKAYKIVSGERGKPLMPEIVIPDLSDIHEPNTYTPEAPSQPQEFDEDDIIGSLMREYSASSDDYEYAYQ